MKPFEEKEILREFIKNLTESLQDWVKHATKVGVPLSASASIVPLDLIRIVEIVNVRLNSFREELKIYYKVYKDIEKKYELKPLSVSYLESYSILTEDLSEALNEVKEISNKYNLILSNSQKNYNVDINKYVPVHNQKAIDKISSMTLEKLLDVLNDNHLLGF
jgi:hypothetical protein